MKSFEQQVIDAIPRLLRYANIFLKDKNLSEDFAQEVVFRVLKKQKHFDSNKGSVETWMRGFAAPKIFRTGDLLEFRGRVLGYGDFHRNVARRPLVL